MMEWQLRGYQSHFSKLLSLPWFRDGLVPLEYAIVYDLMTDITPRDSQSSLQILNMPYLESIDDADLRIGYILDEASLTSDLQSLLAVSALIGGIEDGDLPIVALEYLGLRDSGAATKVKSLSWVADGLASSEGNAMVALQRLGIDASETFDVVVAKSWASDHISSSELAIIWHLWPLASNDDALGGRLLEMPFLDAIDLADVAVVSAVKLSVFGNDRRSFLNRVLSHATLDGGITDADRGIVTAVLRSAYFASAEERNKLLATLMDPAQVVREERTVELPLAGDVVLSVVRAKEITAGVMDLLERAVRGHEGFMGVPFPVDFVFMVVADVGQTGGGASGIILIDHSSWSGNFAGVIAHEAAHLYWAIPPRWMQEGSAEFLEWIAEDKGTPPWKFSIGVDSCSSASNLSELEQKTPSMISEASICHYRMGFVLLHDLYNSLGDAEFRRGFGELFLKLDADRSDLTRQPECAVTEASRCYLRAAFVAGASSPELAASASDLIDRWYYGP